MPIRGRILSRALAASALLATLGAAPLDARVDAMFTSWNATTPGLVIAAMKAGKIVLARAYGSSDLRFGLPMRTDTSFNVGSVAKQFTAFAILRLVSDGRVGIDDPVGKYVSGLSTLAASVTIRQLLEHTSGLRDYFALLQMSGLTIEDYLDSNGVVRLANAQAQFDFPPGTDYEYSNTNYVLLALVVERVTGESLDQYLRSLVFSKLGMKHTRIVSAHGTPIQNQASSYWPSDRGAFVERAALLDTEGDGNLVTSAADLLRWEDNLDTRKIGGTIVTRMIQRGATPGSRPPSDRFVNGLFVDDFKGTLRLESDGGIAGYRAYAVTFPEARVSVVALTNLVSLFPQVEVDAIATSLLSGTWQRPSFSAPSRTNATPSARAFGPAAYEGKYYGAEVDSTYWVCPATNGGLELRQLRGGTTPLVAVSADRFSGNTWWLTSVKFERDGRDVKDMLLSGRSASDVAFKRVSASCVDAPFR